MGVVGDPGGVGAVGVLAGVVEGKTDGGMAGVQGAQRRHHPAVVHVGQRVRRLEVTGAQLPLATSRRPTAVGVAAAAGVDAVARVPAMEGGAR